MTFFAIQSSKEDLLLGGIDIKILKKLELEPNENLESILTIIIMSQSSPRKTWMMSGGIGTKQKPYRTKSYRVFSFKNMLIYEPKEYPNLPLTVGTTIYDYLTGECLGLITDIADECLAFYLTHGNRRAVYMHGLSYGFWGYYWVEHPLSINFSFYKITKPRIKIKC
jgi:hypothetical protein